MKYWRQLAAAERTEAIRKYCEPGMSRSQMAYVLGRDGLIFDATRNAIISHIARQMPDWPKTVRGGQPKPRSSANGKRPWRRTVTPPNRNETRLKRVNDLSNPPPPVEVAAADPEGRNKITLDDMPMMGRCRYPLWPNNALPKADQMFFCGEETVQETSWCQFHHQRCITRHQPRPIFLKGKSNAPAAQLGDR